MSDPNKPVDLHYQSAREKAAGAKGAQVWIQDLIAAGLTRDQHPIRDEPFPGPQEDK